MLRDLGMPVCNNGRVESLLTDINNATVEIENALHALAVEACKSEDPHFVMRLMKEFQTAANTARRLDRDLRREFENH